MITGESGKPFLSYFDNYEFVERLIFESMKKIIQSSGIMKENEEKR